MALILFCGKDIFMVTQESRPENLENLSVIWNLYHGNYIDISLVAAHFWSNFQFHNFCWFPVYFPWLENLSFILQVFQDAWETCYKTSQRSGHENFLDSSAPSTKLKVLRHLLSCSLRPNIIDNYKNLVAFRLKLILAWRHADLTNHRNPEFTRQSDSDTAASSTRENSHWWCSPPCCRCPSDRPARTSPSPPEPAVPALRARGRSGTGWSWAALRSLRTVRGDGRVNATGSLFMRRSWTLHDAVRFKVNAVLLFDSQTDHAVKPMLHFWLDQKHRRWLTWEGGDVVFEQAVRLPSFGHEAGERSLHVPPLAGGFLPQHLVVGHGFSEGLHSGWQREFSFLDTNWQTLLGQTTVKTATAVS